MKWVYLQYDNEKPVKVPVREPDKLPKDGTVTIKGKKYKVFTNDLKQINQTFWSTESKEKRGSRDTKPSNGKENYNKWLENMKILKETGKFPKE